MAGTLLNDMGQRSDQVINEIAIRSTNGVSRALQRDPYTRRNRGIWGAGDYDRIAAGFRHEARAFVERQALYPRERVLDAACGTGNVTIPAARTGAIVTGVDLVPSLLDVAHAWASREALGIRFDQGTVEDLPYGDAQFDVVLSMFGTMFAPRPDRVVSELARITKPGGRVVLANWIRYGFIGRMLALHVQFVPPPADLPSPLLWGDESVVRERFDARTWDVRVAVRTLTFRYPYSPAGTAELFRTAYGPTVRTFEAIDEDRRAEFAAALAELWTRHQSPGADGTEVDSEYLEVVAVRR